MTFNYASSNTDNSKPDSNELLYGLLDLVFDNKILIVAVLTLSLLVGFVYVSFSIPIYRTDALLQVEERKSRNSALEELSAMFSGEVPAVTEIEIIRSRTVLGEAVDKLNMNIQVFPNHFPIVGELVKRNNEMTSPRLRKSLFGLNKYAWGGEEITIDYLELPKKYIGQMLILEVLDSEKYRLSDAGGNVLLEGFRGAKANSIAGDVSLNVSKMIANHGTIFFVRKLSRQSVVAYLQKYLHVSEKGKNTGILQIVLEGEDPNVIADVVNTIANTYLRQNVERRSAEAEQTLAFLNKQLPLLKSSLDASETVLNEYRSSRGSVDLTLEAQTYIDQLSVLERKIQEMELEREEMRQKFTEQHPATIALNKKYIKLQAEKAQINENIKRLPEAEQESVRLMRDVTVANELYLLLLNKAQELKVVKAGTVGNVRILDPAMVPLKAVFPNKKRIMVLSFMFGLLFAVLSAFIRKFFDNGIADPDLVERLIGLPVFATVVHSKVQDGLIRKINREAGERLPLLALEEPNDLSIESLRGLRTALQFSMIEAKNNIIAIGGASPNVGKSFVSVNLSVVLADLDKRVLLIDGDLRKGNAHRYFSIERSPGLSELVSGIAEPEDVVFHLAKGNLDFIPAGTIPPNPSELLINSKFKDFLEKVSSSYDYVVIDTPPILAVTDAIVIGKHVSNFFIVLKSGAHSTREISLTVKRLEQNGVKANGFVLNDYPIKAGFSGKYKYGYSYQYKY